MQVTPWRIVVDWYGWLPRNWSDRSAIFQILQFFLLFAALVHAKGQANEAAKSRELAATQALYCGHFQYLAETWIRVVSRQYGSSAPTSVIVANSQRG